MDYSKRICALTVLLVMMAFATRGEPLEIASPWRDAQHVTCQLRKNFENLKLSINVMDIIITVQRTHHPVSLLRNTGVTGGTLLSFGCVPVYTRTNNARRNAMYVSFGIVYIDPPGVGGYSRPSIGPCCALHF